MDRALLLKKIFEDPPSAEGITWDDIRSYLEELVHERGPDRGKISSGNGARTRILLDGVVGEFPYPQVANVGMIMRTRHFLTKVGVTGP